MFGRVSAKKARGFAAFDATPKLALRGDDQMLLERIGMGRDFDPLAAAGDHRQHRGSGRYHPRLGFERQKGHRL